MKTAMLLVSTLIFANGALAQVKPPVPAPMKVAPKESAAQPAIPAPPAQPIAPTESLESIKKRCLTFYRAIDYELQDLANAYAAGIGAIGATFAVERQK